MMKFKADCYLNFPLIPPVHLNPPSGTHADLFLCCHPQLNFRDSFLFTLNVIF